ncbi:myb family transcription factor PHL5-like [Mercurialis annua]|uniref:myb family transcription factor PHL5-like n=1 Tax=Mercurialis annua TaxID=3986 RepID=UPI002160129E|nr:myb family transcription factor PHL5-like [Mercurialis annua]
MNTSKIDFQERIQQNHGMISNFPLQSSQFFGNMEIGAQSSGQLQQQNLIRPDHHKQQYSCNSIMSRFESPASAFYATERLFMGFPQYGYGQLNSPVTSFPYYSKPYGENYAIDPADQQLDHNLELRSNLQSIVKSRFSDNHSSQYSVPVRGDQDHNRFGNNSYAQLGFCSRQEAHSPGVGSANSMPALSNKTRIRWTQDLHEKFVQCVNRLGGAEKATPKAILKLMDSDGLTIFHVKSHLQKYRIAKYMPDSSEGKAEKRNSINDLSHMDPKTGMQITEALQLQLDVQRRLHEQLEIQKNLQLRIEEQGRQLKKMFDEQQQRTNNISNNEFSIEDVEISIVDEGSNGISNFPSKIS